MNLKPHIVWQSLADGTLKAKKYPRGCVHFKMLATLCSPEVLEGASTLKNYANSSVGQTIEALFRCLN